MKIDISICRWAAPHLTFLQCVYHAIRISSVVYLFEILAQRLRKNLRVERQRVQLLFNAFRCAVVCALESS